MLPQVNIPCRLGVERRGHFVRGTWRPPSLVEKLLSGGGIKCVEPANLACSMVGVMC
jgi:hypothetical protein